MTTETKLHDSFPTMQVNIEGYFTFRLDGNEYGDGVLLYVRDEIPSKLNPMRDSKHWRFFHKIAFEKKKWLLHCTYNPNRRK